MFLPCSFALQDQKDDSHMQVCFLEHSNNNYPPQGQKYPQGLLTQTAIASAVRNKIDRNAFLHDPNKSAWESHFNEQWASVHMSISDLVKCA